MSIPNFQDVILQTYSKELAEREIIFNRSNLHITISITLITAITYIAKSIEIEESDPIQLTIISSLIAIWLALIFTSLFFTRKALTDYKYQEIPKAQDIIDFSTNSINYKNNIEIYNQQHATHHSAPDPQEETNRLVLDSLAQASDLNHQINQDRRNHLQKSLKFILASVPILISVAAIFVIFDMDASSPRKDNGIHDKRLTAAVTELNKTLQAQRISLKKENNMVTQNSNKPAGSSTTSSPPSAPPTQGVQNPTPVPTPPKRPSLQISNESYDPPFKRQTLNETTEK